MTENIYKGPLDYMIKSALRFLQNYLIEERISSYPALEHSISATAMQNNNIRGKKMTELILLLQF